MLGIGINVRRTPFPTELASIASDLETETGICIDKDELITRLLQKLAGAEAAFASRAFMQTYREHCMVLGKDITVIRGNERFAAHALDVTDRGELVIVADGKEQILPSGEISVRF